MGITGPPEGLAATNGPSSVGVTDTDKPGKPPPAKDRPAVTFHADYNGCKKTTPHVEKMENHHPAQPNKVVKTVTIANHDHHLGKGVGLPEANSAPATGIVPRMSMVATQESFC